MKNPREYNGPKFQEWDSTARMAVRMVVAWNGGEIAAYTDTGLTVAMPVDFNDIAAITRTLEGAGLDMVDEVFFPLVSDKPPVHQRHHMNQKPTDAPGYWRWAKFEPMADPAAQEQHRDTAHNHFTAEFNPGG